MREKLIKPRTLIVLVLTVVALAAALRVVGGARRPAGEKLSEPIGRDKIIESVYGIGTVKANRSFQLKPGVVSTVSAIFVKEGDTVESGQDLLELGRGVTIKAPFGGTVTALPVKLGENVFAQTVVLELVDLSDRYVTVSLEQRAAVRVRRGQNARLSFENLRELSFAGVVESVYSHDSDFLVRIEARELSPEILPGMTADVAIGVNEKAGALLVPVAALSGDSVWVKRDHRRIFPVPVTIGVVDGAVAEVTSGDLRPGDRVLLAPEPKK